MSAATPTVILGIDPGTARTGYGVILKHPRPIARGSRAGGRAQHPRLECVDYGCIQTPKEEEPANRLLMLEAGMRKIIRTHRPDVIAVERLYFFKNLKTAMPVSEARGVILLSAARAKASIIELSPPQVKHAIAGYGKAEKRQIQRMVKEILGLESIPRPDDAADALAIAAACSVLV